MDRVGFSIFCDDVRQEIDGRCSFMGMYFGVVNVSEPFPVILPKLTIAIWLIVDKQDKVEWMKVTMKHSDDQKEVILADAERINQPLPGNNPSDRAYHLVVRSMAGFKINQQGFIQLNIETEKGKINAGRLEIVSEKPF